MQLIEMVVVPMIFVFIVDGVSSIENSKGTGKIGFFTFLYYGVTKAVSVAIDLLVSEIFRPGAASI